MDSGRCNIGGAPNYLADDDFVCTYAPTLWSCPSYKVTLAPKSTYYVMVMSMGTCSGPYGEYDLTVQTDSDPSLTLVADDENVWTTLITSSATIHVPPL